METNATGRSGTASITGPSSMYLNPAGLAGLQGYGVEASGDVGINGLLLDYGDWARKNSSQFNNFDSLLAHMDPALENKWAPYAESYMLQGHYKDYAVSVVRDSRYDLTLGEAVLTPVIGADIQSDLQVMVGRGFVASPNWNVGVAVKYLYRQYFPDVLLGPNDDEYYVLKSCWEGSSGTLMDKRDKVTCASKFAKDEYGFGVNLGTSYTLPVGFSVGASVLDLPTFFNGGFMYPQANVGGAYALNIPGFEAFEDLTYRLLVNIDYQLPFTLDPWFKQWKTGASFEGKLYNREVALLSAGLNDGYPVYGARVGYFLYAYYLYTAEETGNYPGQRKLYFHKFGVDLNF